MPGQKKIMIVTSDEDLIHQLSSHKTPNRCIIDLDGTNQSVTMSNNNENITDLTFLAQLSQLVNISYFLQSKKLKEFFTEFKS
jgi:hypothetical protein